MTIAYLNGKFLPLTDVYIPVLDRGFIFGDGVYEVIPVYGRKLFRLAEHLDRLENSLAQIQLSNPLTHEQWQTALETLVAQNDANDQSIYLQVTRGPAKRHHNFPATVSPTVFMMSDPFTDPAPSPGVKAITCADTRWQKCHIKSISLLGNVLLRQQAVEAGAAEAILIREGYITEGAASNVFIVEKGVVMTPPKGPFILSGITRDLILEVMAGAQLPFQEIAFSETQLRHADEVWVTSSTREILPVTRLDDKQVGQGQPGPVWAKVWQLFQVYKQKLRVKG